MAARFVPRSLSHKPKKTNPLPKIRKQNLQETFPRSSQINSTLLRDETNESKDKIDVRASESEGFETGACLSLVNVDETTKSVIPKGERKLEEVDSDEDEVVYFSKNQRWPENEEPICIVCGRYGEYICDQTEADVCSKECKAKNLQLRQAAETNKEDSVDSILNRVNKDELHVQKAENCDPKMESAFQPYSYREHPVVASLSVSQVNELRSRMEITVKGDTIERPILEFCHCNLDVRLLENLKSCGYETPTPVQMQVIPVALHGCDVLACAQTGSGKTAAFLIPMITRIYHDLSVKQEDVSIASLPKGLVLAPTRELCMQIERQAKELMAGLSCMKTALIVGGMPLPNQVYRLKQGVQIVFATPGRLAELMDKTDTDFSQIKILVIDEVDVLMQMGFENQVQSILETIPRERQTLLFSATIPPTVERMSTSLLNNPTWISVGSPSAPNMAVKQIVLWVDDKSKKKRLFSLLKDCKYFTPPVLVFVDSKMGADLLAEAIQKTCNIHCTSMHGDKVQNERTRILEEFLAGEYDVLVCTGVMGRGLDLRCVKQN